MAFTSHHHRGSPEAGIGVVEVLVSATLLVISLLALYSVLDTQSHASAENRDSSAASSLAESDQERLRSFRATDIAGRDEVRAVTVGTQAFSVRSTVEWIRDDTGGTQGCANATKQSDYLRLTSSVTGDNLNYPVVLRSIVAPPLSQYNGKQGTLGVSVVNAQGAPVQGAGVSITGPASTSDETNDVGCAVFNHVDPGAYSVQVTGQGFVDTSGVSPAMASITSSAGTVNTINVAVDQAASATVTFVTKPKGGSDQVAPIATMTAAEAEIPGCPSSNPNCATPTPGVRLFSTATANKPITAGQLFPFKDAYTFYAGTCARNNPERWTSNYFTSGTHQGRLALAPGSSNVLQQVRVPALNLKLKRNATNQTWHVVAKPSDSGCTTSYEWPAFASTAQEVTLPNPGIPFGNYVVCVDDGTNKRTTTSAVGVTGEAGSTEVSFDFSNTSIPNTQTATPSSKCTP